jgi:DNA end-binding protein Ku
MWTGVISFGLLNVPVRLYRGSEERALSFDMLHKKDLSPIRFARICLADGQEIPYKDIVKGYEYEKGEYVVIDESEFKKADKEKSETIAIMHFALEEEIDPIFFEKPYFLEPGKGGNKAYALLLETLRTSKKVAIVKFVFLNKEHLGALKPYQDCLTLIQMRFMDEVRSHDELKLPQKGEVTKKELDMSLKLVKQLTQKFDPKKYHDEYTEEIKEVIEAKIKGLSLAPKKAAKKSTKVHDISALLKASLEETHHPKKGAKPKRKVG